MLKSAGQTHFQDRPPARNSSDSPGVCVALCLTLSGFIRTLDAWIPQFTSRFWAKKLLERAPKNALNQAQGISIP